MKNLTYLFNKKLYNPTIKNTITRNDDG